MKSCKTINPTLPHIILKIITLPKVILLQELFKFESMSKRNSSGAGLTSLRTVHCVAAFGGPKFAAVQLAAKRNYCDSASIKCS
jgi:hypothetical protein